MNILNTVKHDENAMADAIGRIAARETIAAKAGNTEFTKEQFDKLHSNKFYVVAFKTVYQPVKKGESRCFVIVHKYRGSDPLTRRGRFISMDWKEVNSLLGFELLIDDYWN